MRKLLRNAVVLGTALVTLAGFVGCKTQLAELEYSDESKSNEIIIGKEVVYGNEFSLGEVFSVQARSAAVSENDFVDMVYFSVLPTSFNSLKMLNDTMGTLNPFELNHEVLQSCDAGTLILRDDIDLEKEENYENIVRFDIPYYYIDTKENAEQFSRVLEGFNVIEEFRMLSEETQQNVTEEDERSARWGIPTYSVNGKLRYRLDGKDINAYGIKVHLASGAACTTDKYGNYNLGKKSALACICWLWADYYNDACEIRELLNLNTSTLLRVASPSLMTNNIITATEGFPIAKMAICGELLYRHDKEQAIHGNIPTAYIWATMSGTGTSSAPCFSKMSDVLLDIYYGGCKSYTEQNIHVIHHEYTHYLHNVYTGNKDNFWQKIINSEIGSSTVHTLGKLMDSVFKTGNVKPFYDFSNKYVCFAENLAEWYASYGLENGIYGESRNMKYTDAVYYEQTIYQNVVLLKEITISDILYTLEDVATNDEKKILDTPPATVKQINKLNDTMQILENRRREMSSVELVRIIDVYDITTFQELYDALVTLHSDKKNDIEKCFSLYIPYGNKIALKN